MVIPTKNSHPKGPNLRLGCDEFFQVIRLLVPVEVGAFRLKFAKHTANRFHTRLGYQRPLSVMTDLMNSAIRSHDTGKDIQI